MGFLNRKLIVNYEHLANLLSHSFLTVMMLSCVANHENRFMYISNRNCL